MFWNVWEIIDCCTFCLNYNENKWIWASPNYRFFSPPNCVPASQAGIYFGDNFFFSIIENCMYKKWQVIYIKKSFNTFILNDNYEIRGVKNRVGLCEKNVWIHSWGVLL